MLLAQVLWIPKLLRLPVLPRLPSLSSSRGQSQFTGTPGPIQEPAQQDNTGAEIALAWNITASPGMAVSGWPAPTEDTIAARQTVQVEKTQKWGRRVQSSLHQKALFSESAGWHHRLYGHEFEQTLGVGDGQGGLACCDSCRQRVGHDWATVLNWIELNGHRRKKKRLYFRQLPTDTNPEIMVKSLFSHSLFNFCF